VSSGLNSAGAAVGAAYNLLRIAKLLAPAAA
jgi:hypothetical protein